MSNFNISDTLLTYSEKNRYSKFIGIQGNKKRIAKDELKIVLEINNLSIDDELVFVFGYSGSGKSTLLEALGLMNDTIVGKCEGHPDGSKVFAPLWKDGVKKELDLENLWEGENKKALFSTRKDFYSFIFQSTVLLPNFTVVENVILPTLIEQGADYYKSYLKAIILLNELNLHDLQVSKKQNQVSGGQRQRIAFARAFLPNFKVLFGDEPTGNLDEINAEHLFNFLKFHIHAQQKCGIIVSHSIDLTLNYADKIILLTPKDKNRPELGCEIIPANIYIRKEKMMPISSNQNTIIDDVYRKFSKKEIEQYIDKIKHEKTPTTMVCDVINYFMINELVEITDCRYKNGDWLKLNDSTTFNHECMKEMLRECLNKNEKKCGSAK
jgi:ABC-type lipoprotein export system ATPase subunit